MQKNIIIKLSQQLSEVHKVFYLKGQQLLIAKGNICLHKQLGQCIDLVWQKTKGNMILQKSQYLNKFAYQKDQNLEIFRGIEFRHSYKCPYINDDIAKSEKYYKPSACVLISTHDKNDVEKILVTRRKLTLNSFPGAWVLPGGHLQQGQTLIQGGLREAYQQIGLDIKTAQIKPNHQVMAWQSAFYVNNKIVSSNIILFFNIYSPTQFQAVPQQSQIQEHVWKDIKYNSDQSQFCHIQKNGYGEAHLNYLSFYRNRMYGIFEQKLWERQITEKQQQIQQKNNNIKLNQKKENISSML